MPVARREEFRLCLSGDRQGAFQTFASEVPCCGLGVPKEKAVNIVHGQVATQARGLIIAACAGARSKNNQQNLVSLLEYGSKIDYRQPRCQIHCNWFK